ncbi:MAG: HAD-IA family hydrolase [Candidatus Jorgensenbacteria bacterium]|nr:HAD-IA family hydrolase [Candidatus Jorgensenbacteria bacterium]
MKAILVDAAGTFTVNGRIFQKMHELLETYPNRKIILTNAERGVQMEKFGLNNVPYEIFTLEHEPNKDNPEYFRAMLKHFGLTKDDVIYFDHSPEAVKSAQSVGILSYHYNSDVKDLAALKNFLDASLTP